MVKRVSFVFVIFYCAVMQLSVSHAALGDTVDIATSVVDSWLGEDDSVLVEKIQNGIEDDEVNKSFVRYINTVNRVDSNYIEIMQSTAALGLWAYQEVPIFGGPMYSILTNTVLFGYKAVLSYNANTESENALEEIIEHYRDAEMEWVDFMLDGGIMDDGVLSTMRGTIVGNKLFSAKNAIKDVNNMLSYQSKHLYITGLR